MRVCPKLKFNPIVESFRCIFCWFPRSAWEPEGKI